VTASIAIPPSWSRKKTVAAISRPDADNYGKAALDALNEVVWGDDSQVVDLRVIKSYAERPQLLIEVAPCHCAALRHRRGPTS